MDAQVFLWVVSIVLFIVGAFINPPRVSLLHFGLALFAAGFLVNAVN